MSAPDTPAEGVCVTIPAGHPLLADVVGDAERMTDLLADLVSELRADPVDLIAVRRHAVALFELAEELDSDVDVDFLVSKGTP